MAKVDGPDDDLDTDEDPDKVASDDPEFSDDEDEDDDEEDPDEIAQKDPDFKD